MTDRSWLANFRVLNGADLPPRLADLEEPPETLYVRGELPRGPSVAIVGTRKPSANALRFAFDLGKALSVEGVSVFSGGAAGIDTAAHEGALAGSGFTVVIAPAGYERCYPEQNAALFANILARGGAYVSLVPDQVRAHPGAFFARNRCLVALAHATVVVEAPFRSGALNAAACARQLGRLLFAVPSPPWNKRGRGCILELKRGARPLGSPRDVLEALGEQNLHPLGVRPKRRRQRPSNQLAFELGDQEEIRVLGAVREGARHPDEICERTGLAAARVQALVLTLTLKGALVPGPDGGPRVASPPRTPRNGPPR